MAYERQVWQVTGADRFRFLQGLITNDMLPLEKAPGILWAAILTPQGKYLADFFVVRQGNTLLIDIAASAAVATLRRLTMYRLRADVQITDAGLSVSRGLGTPPQGALPDPRHAGLGWRAYGPDHTPDTIDWDAIRVAHTIPETGIELIPDETFPLEARFEALHGVDYRKGCYVGQEVTARMKHKTTLRKGLATVAITGTAPAGTPIMADDKEAGTLFTVSGDQAIAYLRFDRAGGPMRAGDADVIWTQDQPGLAEA